MTALTDARGCLTDEGFAALARSRPGEAPAELATHLAACARCQDRVLKAAAGAEAASRPRGALRSAGHRWGMLALVIGVLLVAIVGLLATLAFVRG